MDKPDGTSDNSVAIEWLCKFCSLWNLWSHRYCKRCLAQKQYALKEQR